MTSLLGEAMICQRIYQRFVDIASNLYRWLSAATSVWQPRLLLALENGTVSLEGRNKSVDQ
jgi:hypothetical protein